MREDKRIIWEPQPGPQTELVTCPVFEVFFAGARGGGKTDGCLGDFANHAAQYKKDATGLWVRKQRIELSETIERSKQLFSGDATFHEQEKVWRFRNGARLRFGYLENDKDAEAYQGHSYTKVYVEELTNFATPGPVMKLMATLRSPCGVPVSFRATGNPGGPGHAWVKERYIDPAPKGYKVVVSEFRDPWTKEVLTRERVFIPSFVKDNKYLGAEYIANLSLAGPPELVRAWLEGDWNVILGSFFPELSKIHQIPDLIVPDYWGKFAWYDWGFAAPACCLWFCISDGEAAHTVLGDDVALPRGALAVYRELYLCDKKTSHLGARLTNKEQAKYILRAAAGDSIAAYFADLPSFKSQGSTTPATEMAEEGLNLRLGSHSRIPGWAVTRSRIKGVNGLPLLYFCESAKHTWRTMLTLQADPDNLEDALQGGEDHAPDCVRGGCTIKKWVRDQAETTERQMEEIQRRWGKKPSMNAILKGRGDGPFN